MKQSSVHFLQFLIWWGVLTFKELLRVEDLRGKFKVYQ